MINKVGRNIPDEYLHDGTEVFQGEYYRDQYVYTKAAPTTKASVKPVATKVVASLEEAIKRSGLKDGMTVSFHHHFRNGDYVCNMVMKIVHDLGIKDLMVCASSLGKAQDYLEICIKDGTVTGISSSGVRDGIGRAISAGELKNPAYIRSHGGRVQAIETGKVHIDVAFIGAPTADVMGNARGVGGKSDCGVLSYAEVDAKYADQVIVITDTLVATPNFPASIKGVDVDMVVVVDAIGDPTKIATGIIRLTQDPRELEMAENAAKCMAYSGYFNQGFSFQTGGGGASLAVTRFLKPYLDERKIKLGFIFGGITEPIVNLLHDGYVDHILDAQAFDTASIQSVREDKNHHEATTSEYANPFNKGSFVNQLDFVILGALEIDVDYNVNVILGSDGMIQGAPGGHVDTAAGAKVTIIVAPLIRSRITTVRDHVTSITTPGESIDILVTDYGVAINPRRPDLIAALKQTDLPLKTIEELRDEAYEIAGKPKEIEFEDKVVALVEYRDGTLIDVIRKPKNLFL